MGKEAQQFNEMSVLVKEKVFSDFQTEFCQTKHKVQFALAKETFFSIYFSGH